MIELSELNGIGVTIIKRLNQAGITSVESLARTPKCKLINDTCLGEHIVHKLMDESWSLLGMRFESAIKVWEKRRAMGRLTTGCQGLDEILAGGIEPMALTEIFGESGTGKTQLSHQLCVNTQLSCELGGLNGNALYIDTEGTFRPERIVQMAESLHLDSEKVLKSIIIGRACNSDHQIKLINEAPIIIEKKNIKLLVIDSIVSHFRVEYGIDLEGDEEKSSKDRKGFKALSEHLGEIRRLANNYELTVVITNQVYKKSNIFYGNPIYHIGGHVMAHNSVCRIYLSFCEGIRRIARLVEAPHLPEGEATFLITREGIK